MTYAQMRATNVHATQEVLRLATTHHLKPVHFVSTVSTVPTGGCEQDTFPEDAVLSASGCVRAAVPPSKAAAVVALPPKPRVLTRTCTTHTHTHTYMCAHARTHTLAHRYVATKYVGEQLLKAAAKQGVPTTLFRPAFISNHSRTGQGNVSDFLNRYLAGCVQLGAALGGDAFDKPTTVLDMTPVDYVAGAIVFLARRRRSEGQSFHILSSLDKLPTYSTVARVMVECGYRVESVEYVCFCVCAAAAAAAVVLVVDVVVWSGCECWWPGVSCCSRRMQGQM